MGLIARAALVLALPLGACSLVTDSFQTNEFSGDPFPINIELDSGAVMLGVRQDGVPDRAAILDVLSPITLVDPGPGVAPSIDGADLLLLAQAAPGTAIEHPRARLTDVSLVSFHPCSDDSDPCVVGSVAAPREFQAIIGADSLAGDAVRLRLGDRQVFILADVGGDEQERTRACDGVFLAPYRGGGTLLLGGTEVGFGGRRIALSTCLGAAPDPALPQGQRGADTLFVMSTSIGITLLGEAAYERYRFAHPTAPLLAQLPEESVLLPSGPVLGRVATIDNLALVASSSSAPRAACRQVYASHFMTRRDCAQGDDCPCEDGDEFCPTPAILELAPPGGIRILIVPDANPTLQSLRTELRPDQAEVDGILGTNAILAAEIDVDYPHNRLLARCTGEGCVTRPQLTQARDRIQARGCLEYAPPGPVF